MNGVGAFRPQQSHPRSIPDYPVAKRVGKRLEPLIGLFQSAPLKSWVLLSLVVKEFGSSLACAICPQRDPVGSFRGAKPNAVALFVVSAAAIAADGEASTWFSTKAGSIAHNSRLPGRRKTQLGRSASRTKPWPRRRGVRGDRSLNSRRGGVVDPGCLRQRDALVARQVSGRWHDRRAAWIIAAIPLARLAVWPKNV
jgi:hypothetical protein